MKKIGICIALLLLLVLPVGAEDNPPQTIEELYQQQLEASGAEELFHYLSDDAKDFLYRLGIDNFQMEGLQNQKPEGVLSALLSMLSDQSGTVVRTGSLVLGVVLLCAMMEGVRQTVKEPAMADVFGIIASLVACAVVVMPIASCIRQVCDTAESTSVFMLSFVPVYTGIAVAGGQVAVAASYQTVVLFVAELITAITVQVVLPLMIISLGISVTGTVAPGVKLDGVSGLLNKTGVWLLTLSVTIFVGMLSLQAVVGEAADTLGAKALKFSIGSFVPVVGNPLSEAFNTVRGCLHLLKSGVGVFGIAAIAAMVLPTMLQCILWVLCLHICLAASDMFELKTLSALFKAILGVVKTCIGLLAACSMFMIIATTIVLKAGGGG